MNSISTPDQAHGTAVRRWAGWGFRTWTAGILGSVLAAVLVAWLGIGGGSQLGVSIDGPTTARSGAAFLLVGDVTGDENSTARWTDTFGTHALLSSGGDQVFYCPGVGRFTVTLTATSGDRRAQDDHSITCVP